MFGLGMWEILVILVVGLIFIGPQKLPDVVRSLGKGLREFRSATDQLRNTISDPIDQATKPIKKALFEPDDEGEDVEVVRTGKPQAPNPESVPTAIENPDPYGLEGDVDTPAGESTEPVSKPIDESSEDRKKDGEDGP